MISLVVAVVFGVRPPFRVEQPERRPSSAMCLPSVPALAAGWGVTVAVGGIAAFFVFVLVAAVDQLLLSFEVAVSPRPRRAARGEEGSARSR